MESSQQTPISRMKVVDSLLTDHSGYPKTFPMTALQISYSQCTPYSARPAQTASVFFLWISVQ